MIQGPAIEAIGIEFGYDRGAPVLRGVDLAVAPGEVVGLIGPNGSGKSTLVNLLCATVMPGAGEVRILGDPASSLSASERARRVAVVPQAPRVAFPFTVMEIVLMGRSPHLARFQLEAAGDREIAGQAISSVKLDGFERRAFHQLSGGERQRVMIAKALAQAPKILLMDEPTAFLDIKHQVETYELVRSLARDRGMAALMVSHDVNLAAAYCDRVAALFGGKIVADGDPRQALTPELFAQVYGIEVGVARRTDQDDAPIFFPLRAGPGQDGTSE